METIKKHCVWSMLLSAGLFTSACATHPPQTPKDSISGIYPRLAYYNNEGECGTGAVVPWADRLWVVTYGPHLPFGSSDKLYEVTPDMQLVTRPESLGGTPANRMIHRESKQLFIGPYAIDSQANVRPIGYNLMPGRHTGNARHLSDPENKIYYATMEEGFYEVDVHTLAVTQLYKDGNFNKNGENDLDQHVGADGLYKDNNPSKKNKSNAVGPQNDLIPGVHGKGLYSGQGVMLYTNNGEGTSEAQRKFDVEAGALAEWDGKEWKVVRRNQFVEVTGPGGIYGNPNPDTDPIWATGWDYKSIILGTRDPQKGWSFYRLPKASHSYDGAHGWNTEWPRIRNIGTDENPDYMMTMHGMFWHFPQSFTADNTAGIRPRSAYLKVIGDFTRWNDQLVFGCDDSAQKEFLNKRSAKGKIEGPGQSNSNLWFTSLQKPDQLGPATAEGAVWSNEAVAAGEYSEPFLFSGWDERCAWVRNHGTTPVVFSFEIDKVGDNIWRPLSQLTLEPGKSANLPFDKKLKAEWIRVKANQATRATVTFAYTDSDQRAVKSDAIFNGLASINQQQMQGGLIYGLGNNRRAMGLLATNFKADGMQETGYYEMDDAFNLIRKEDAETAQIIREHFAIPSKVVTIDESSVLVVDDAKRRWRLPLGQNPDAFKEYTELATLRICREVATERDLFNCMGTFYELPAENADGYAKIRPVASHNFRIHDYASYRGMLVMTGIEPKANANNPHIILSDDKKAAVWCGVIDDLWQMGKPTGQGGPWKNSAVKAGIPSDPYLIACYDKRQLSLTNEADRPVTFTVQVDPTGNGNWMDYQQFNVPANNNVEYSFPDSFQARWIRFVSDSDTKATAWLIYR